MITLKCAFDNGSVAFHAELIEGVHAPERRYAISNGTVLLDGYDAVVLQHDVDVLLSMPGELYRMLTPKEQNAAAKAKQDASTVEESIPVAQAETPPVVSLKKSLGG